MTSTELKLALLSYYRFKRNMICATEAFCSDVVAIDDKYVYEIECKTSKRDMWIGELAKGKHYANKQQEEATSYYFRPNKYYMCVPPELTEEALKWVASVNDKYGIIECNGDFHHNIKFVKRAKLLHNRPTNDYRIKRLMLRVCSENIGFLERQVKCNERQNTTSV